MLKLKFLSVAILLAMVLISCNDTEVPIEGLSADVEFNMLKSADSEILKNGDVNRDAISDDDIRVAVKDITIVATSTREILTNKFTVVENGGADGIVMKDIPLGHNDFNVLTSPYPETKANDPVSGEADGFSSYTGMPSEWMKEWNWQQWKFDWWKNILHKNLEANKAIDKVESTKDMATLLRMIVPDVVFEGNASSDIKAEDNDAISVEMFAKQGRSIVTVEFEDGRRQLGLDYYAVCKLTLNGQGVTGDAPARTATLGEDGFVWFYASDSYVNSNTESELNIKVYAKGASRTPNNVLWEVNIDDEDKGSNDKFLIKIENGVDRWGRIILTEDGLSQGCQGFKLDLKWVEEDTESLLGEK